MTERRALLAAIHIARKELAIAEDSWPELVQRIAGAPSCALVNDEGLRAVKAELARLGAIFVKRSVAGVNSRGDFVKSKKPLARKIFKLWTELKRAGKLRNPTPAALRAFCARSAETGAADTHPDFLTMAQANKVIEALKAWLDRGVAPEGGA